MSVGKAVCRLLRQSQRQACPQALPTSHVSSVPTVGFRSLHTLRSAQVSTRCGQRHPCGAKRCLHVDCVTSVLGAEVKDVQVTDALKNEELVKAIRQALNDHSVLFFRNQDLSASAQEDFAALFGPLEAHPIVKALEGHPYTLQWTKEPGAATEFGETWHTDNSYNLQPTYLSVLYSKEVPPTGNDTLWASTTAAYEALSPGMKKMLDGLTAVHSASEAFSQGGGNREAKYAGDYDGIAYQKSEALVNEVEHPVVRTIPETGHKSLYVNSMFTLRFKDMTKEESRPLLEYLWAHIAKPEFQVRHRWTANCIAMWDNRVVQHLAVNDNFTHRRTMRRVCVTGERPV